MEDQVEKLLSFLNNPKSTDCEDSRLLEDLLHQYRLFCDNFHFGVRLTKQCDQDSIMNSSLCYLQNLVQNSPHSNELSTSPTTLDEHYNNSNDTHAKHTKGVQVRYVNKKKLYFMDDKPIRFKVWKNKPKNGDFRVRWNRNYLQLKEFKERHRHLQVTRSTIGYEELGNWVAEQRRKLKRGKLTLEQFESLTKLGFEWDRSYYFHRTFQEKNHKSNSSY